MRQMKSIWGIGIFMTILAWANATLPVSVSTDKSFYQLGETVHIFVSVYNPTSTEVTLGFATTCQATYLLDGTYSWHEGRPFAQVLTHRTIPSYQAYTWQFNHDAQNQNYSLSPGTHTVQGLVFSVLTDYQYSESAAFQVVPEPATLLLLGLGSLILRKRKS